MLYNLLFVPVNGTSIDTKEIEKILSHLESAKNLKLEFSILSEDLSIPTNTS